MLRYRKYGKQPFKTTLVHGGPGAAGELAPMAQELSKKYDVIELIQTRFSIPELVAELYQQITELSTPPVTLIGHSWGAWLSLIFTAKYGNLVDKLILIGSGPFDKNSAKKIITTRIERLSDDEKAELDNLLITLQNPDEPEKNALFKQLGKLIHKADTFESIKEGNNLVEYNYQLFQKVWAEANQMRNSGELLTLSSKISCPVTAIHGNYDPHPGKNIKNALTGTIPNFKYIELNNCGHEPWSELHAKERFFDILNSEIKT